MNRARWAGSVLLVCLAVFLPKAVKAETCSDGSGDECCADAATVCDYIWTVGTDGNQVSEELRESTESFVVCVQDAGGDLPDVLQVELPEAPSVTICGNAEGAEAPFPALDINFGNESAALHLMNLSFVGEGTGTTRGAVHVDGHLDELTIQQTKVDGWLYAVLLWLDESPDPTVVNVSGLTVESAGTSVLKTNTDVEVEFREVGGEPALTYGPLRSDDPLFRGFEDPAPELKVTGRLQRDLDSAGPVAGLTNSSDLFGTVTLETLEVDGYDCEICVVADTIRVTDTTWRLLEHGPDGDPAGPGLWLKANDDGSGSSAGLVTLDQVTFQTEGAPWQLAKANKVEAVGLNYCAAGTNTIGSTGHLGVVSVGSSASIWNSAIVVANDGGPLVADAGGSLGLRGVTVVTGNTTGDLVPDMSEFQATNTLFVGRDAPASEALVDRDEGWPSHVLRASAADAVFQSPSTVFSCGAPPIPDAPTTGTRGKGVQKFMDEFGVEQLLWSLAGNELQNVRTDPGQGDDWCDPDGEEGSWPDIGAWSGPLSPDVFDPEITPRRPCNMMEGDTSSPPVDTATPDSGGTDTSGPTPDDSGDPANLLRYSWGGTCGGCGGSAAVVVPVMALWWRRRRRRTA